MGFDLDQMQMSAEEAAVTEVSVRCDAALCQITLDTLVPFPHYERKNDCGAPTVIFYLSYFSRYIPITL